MNNAYVYLHKNKAHLKYITQRLEYRAASYPPKYPARRIVFDSSIVNTIGLALMQHQRSWRVDKVLWKGHLNTFYTPRTNKNGHAILTFLAPESSE